MTAPTLLIRARVRYSTHGASMSDADGLAGRLFERHGRSVWQYLRALTVRRAQVFRCICLVHGMHQDGRHIQYSGELIKCLTSNIYGPLACGSQTHHP